MLHLTWKKYSKIRNYPGREMIDPLLIRIWVLSNVLQNELLLHKKQKQFYKCSVITIMNILHKETWLVI